MNRTSPYCTCIYWQNPLAIILPLHYSCGRSIENIRIDSSTLYPQGFHPVRDNEDRGGVRSNEHWPRNLTPVRYYFNNFKKSVHFTTAPDSGSEYTNRSAFGPFKEDIMAIGLMLRQQFHHVNCSHRLNCWTLILIGLLILQKYSNLGFLHPLIQSMTQNNPAECPTAAEALQTWQEIRRNRRIRGCFDCIRIVRERDDSCGTDLILGSLYLVVCFFVVLRWIYIWSCDLQG